MIESAKGPDALAIIGRSDDLASGFALWASPRGASPLDAVAAKEYLLWRTVFAGALGYPRIIDADIFAVITTPAPPYLTALEAYVVTKAEHAARTGDPRSILQAHKWYYTQGVEQYGLSALLTVAEILALAGMPSLAAPLASELRLLDEIAVENDSDAKARCDLTTIAGRAACLAWRNAVAFPSWAPWFPVEDARLDARPEIRPAPPTLGVNLIGYADTILGLGEDLTSLQNAARRAGVRTQVLKVAISPAIGSPKAVASNKEETSRPLFPINLFCMPLSETERYRLRHFDHFSQVSYNIGHWAWELSSLPAYWRQAFRYVDEIWTVSPYSARAFQNQTDKPVHYVPPLVQVEEWTPFDLADIGVAPGAFAFLTVCDLNSYTARKNPQGAIEAFRMAFPSGRSNEHLIVKTLNGHSNAREFDHLLRLTADDPRIIVIDGPYTRAQVLGLIQAVDCLLSLHRAEGFGRVLAEALLLETPVVATDYSGSTAFLDEATGFAVNYDLVPVGPEQYCYAEGSVWAEPRLDHAASQMRRVVQDRAEAVSRTRAGRLRIEQNHGLAAVAEALRERFERIEGVLRKR